MSYVEPVGYLAMMVSIASYLMRSHRSLTVAACVALALWSLHYGLQEAWTATAACVLMGFRIVMGVWVVHWPVRARWSATWVGWALTGSAVAATWGGAISIPAGLASMFMVWAGFHLHYKPLRLALLAAEHLWLLNGWLLGSTPAMATSALCIALNVSVMAREARLVGRPAANAVS